MKKITEQDKAFMREAIHMADESVRNGGGPFGAVIVKDGEIIAKAPTASPSTTTPRHMPR